jgi:hypothetical protein
MIRKGMVQISMKKFHLIYKNGESMVNEGRENSIYRK